MQAFQFSELNSQCTVKGFTHGKRRFIRLNCSFSPTTLSEETAGQSVKTVECVLRLN